MHRSSAEVPSAQGVIAVDKEFEHITLNDLDLVATLGIGGFGRVELVSILGNWNGRNSDECF